MGDRKPPDDTAKPSRRKARLNDVAALAGVSIATVDRVLNDRGNVSPKAARKTIEAARKLGLPRILPAPYRRGLRLEVLLVRPDSPFFDRLNRAFHGIATTLDSSVIVERTFLDEAKPLQVAERIRSTKADGLIVYGQEHPAIVDAVRSVTAAGVPVVTLVSDLPTSPRLAYVGSDHYGAGRTASYFVARMIRQPGPVIVLCHSFGYRAHAERVSGFRDGLRDHGPQIEIAATLEGRDDRSLSERLVTDALRRIPGCLGLYNTGGANRAVEAALRAEGKAGKIVFIGHELSEHTRRMLVDGTMTLAIDQNPEEQAQRAIDVLLKRFGHIEGEVAAEEVPVTLFSPENITNAACEG